ncbi:MAG: hypothetical protein AAGF79_13450 [Pseudomonadota bacterium]
MKNLSANAVLGLACIALALVVIFLWVPLDTDTWLVERARGRNTVGDSLAPTLAGVFILVAGLMLLREERLKDERPSLENLTFIGAMCLFGIIALVAMRWAGPLAVSLFAQGEEYRLLRDTLPWKYIGFATGGGFLVLSMVAFIEERVSILGVFVAILSVVLIILLYDVPFEDVLLPPNGDV